MLTLHDLTSLAKARLKDAQILLLAGRYDGAVYLCGYAVDVALKARIVKTLKWEEGFPESRGDFEGLQSFKTHDLETLLFLSGWDARIKRTYPGEWSKVSGWDPESRYERPGGVSQAQAAYIIDTAKRIVGALL